MFFRAIPMTKDERGRRCVVFAVWSEEHPAEMMAMLLGSQGIASYIISDFAAFTPEANGFLGAVFPEDFAKVRGILIQIGFEEKTDPQTIEVIAAEAEKQIERDDPQPCINSR